MTTNPISTPVAPSFQSVNALRRGGQLRAAFQQARDLYAADPANVWNQRALAWVYADRLKETSTLPDPAPLLRGLRLMAHLPLPATESRWREQVLWSVSRYLLRIAPEQLPLEALAELIALGRTFADSEPSLVRSVWTKALLKHSATGIDWLGLLADGGWDAFRPEDYQPEPITGPANSRPRTVGPLVERVCMAATRQVLDAVPVLDSGANPLLDRMQTLAGQHPDWMFLAYYRAKLLLALSRTDEALCAFLPVARRKHAERSGAPFWMWTLLADLVTDDGDQKLSCLVKAVSVKTPESFLVKVRQTLAQRLIGLDRWTDARAEIDRLVATRQHEGWKLPAEVVQWLNDPHYTQAPQTPATEVGAWYAAHLPAAESLLWSDLPETVVLVVAVDADRRMVSFSADAQTGGRLPWDRFGTGVLPAVGDRLAIRSETTREDKRVAVRVHAARPTNEPPTSLRTRTVAGPLRMVAGKAFGFVQSVLVPAGLLAGSVSWADQLVDVVACEAWDARKQTNGWRAFAIAKK